MMEISELPRVSRQAKAASHEKIVEVAARQFREQGINGTGVADVMAAAGLTHGGFYRHFTSKTELTVEAINHAFDDNIARLESVLQLGSGSEGIMTYVTLYLSKQHVDNPGIGCPIATLATEISRQSGDERKAFDNGIARIIDHLANAIGGQEVQARAKAMALISHLTGSVILMRANQSDGQQYTTRQNAQAFAKIILDA